MNPKKFTACLLAGGKSSRMGRDKAGVEFDGVPLWRRQLDTLSQTGADEILISGRRDACYGAGGIPVIEDEIKGCGPLSGVHALLSAAVHPLVLVLAIDMPFMTGKYLRRLVKTALYSGCGVVPEWDGFFEGLAAVYPRMAKKIASKMLSGQDHSMQGFVSECVAKKLAVPVKIAHDETVLFQNVNTPEELAESSP